MSQMLYTRATICVLFVCVIRTVVNADEETNLLTKLDCQVLFVLINRCHQSLNLF